MQTERQKKILIVEDEKSMRESLQETFEDGNFEVLTEEDGESVMDVVKEEEPDIILLDIILPKKDGFEVLSELKGEVGTKNIPVILSTNLSDPSDIQKALDLGATTYLVKSNYSLDDIVKKVGSLI
ncbi:response regulator [bacterium]|jgi:DNA-binding response OmpR family regulator|nr:response regulator [bacterium]